MVIVVGCGGGIWWFVDVVRIYGGGFSFSGLRWWIVLDSGGSGLG
jgi:hypothetical protein